MVVFLAFSPLFIILTISWEGLFYLAFCITLLSWVRLEHAIYNHNKPASSTKANGSSNGTTSKSPASALNPIKPALAAAKNRLDALSKGQYRSLTLADARISLFSLFLILFWTYT